GRNRRAKCNSKSRIRRRGKKVMGLGARVGFLALPTRKNALRRGLRPPSLPRRTFRALGTTRPINFAMIAITTSTEVRMSDTKQDRCGALWRERPNSSAAEIAALYQERHGEECSVVTARKARPRGAEGGEAGPVTAAELKAVKEIAAKNGGLPSL